MQTGERNTSGLGSVLAMAVMGGLLAGCAATPGERLDAADRRLVVTATQEALENNKTGEGGNWLNPANGRRGTVVPMRTYGSDARPCRGFQQTATIEERTIIAYDAACRDAAGRWKSEDYADLDGAIADALPYGERDYYGHHYPHSHSHYRFGLGYGHRYGRFGHFGLGW